MDYYIFMYGLFNFIHLFFLYDSTNLLAKRPINRFIIPFFNSKLIQELKREVQILTEIVNKNIDFTFDFTTSLTYM